MADTSLIEHADLAGREFVNRLTREEQRTAGQFMTPAGIATFMARRLVSGLEAHPVRVLEPAAGAGILAAATIEALLALPIPPVHIELLLCEKDERLLPVLQAFSEKAKALCAAAGTKLDVVIEIGNFLLSTRAIKGEPIKGLIVIANPPFFKLGRYDAEAVAHPYAVHGQPNIYGLFMAACARMVGPGGRWCFISPRSWMSGVYFRAARQSMVQHLTIEGLHAFESRTEGFSEDAVLQELVIAWAVARPQVQTGVSILLTTSAGVSDLATAEVRAVPMERVLSNDGNAVVSLPAIGEDPFEGWTATLSTYGLEVSTGPVVAFRAADFIREQRETGTVPLLWLQHVGQQSIRWPIQKKREHIKATAGSAWMLVKNQPMVVMRRFSPKEDERRVTCAAYTCGADKLPGAFIGLENHLNYIYRPGGQMSPHEARGLAAFLASKVVDGHFRGLAGSTQVNARDLRTLPLPPLAVLVTIGQALSFKPSLAEIDSAVSRALGLNTQDATLVV
jgi:adenine-specific DNA-methyltransferase